MKKPRIIFCLILIGSFLLILQILGRAQTTPMEKSRIIINADFGRETISPYIYGHFCEHLGRCIYGGFWVGENSSIPNVRGIRKDVVEALRKIKIPVLRWPGGCFADTYHWKDGVGPKEKRPSTINTHWGGVVENNHFGTHEFLALCEQLGCEPYICGNVGSGTVQEMAEWIEYMTFDGQSPMADWRRQNGREKPWRIKFFGVGNESWGCGGNMRSEYYADVYRRYRTYIRNFSGNRLYVIACGPYSDNYYWTEILMREAVRLMNGLSLHYYTVPGGWANRGSATKFGEEEWFDTMDRALKIEEYIKRHKAIMDRYDPEKRVGLIVDEWGTWYQVEPGTNPSFLYQQNTLRDALVAGLTLNIFNNHCDRVKMANLAQTINVLQAVLLTQDEKMILTPTYHVFDLYQVHQKATLLPLELKAPDYEFEGKKIPALSASASQDEEGRIHLSLCNLNPRQEIPLICEIRGKAISEIKGRILTASKMNEHNTFEEPKRITPVAFKGARIEGQKIFIRVPAKSVLVVEIN